MCQSLAEGGHRCPADTRVAAQATHDAYYEVWGPDAPPIDSVAAVGARYLDKQEEDRAYTRAGLNPETLRFELHEELRAIYAEHGGDREAAHDALMAWRDERIRQAAEHEAQYHSALKRKYVYGAAPEGIDDQIERARQVAAGERQVLPISEEELSGEAKAKLARDHAYQMAVTYAQAAHQAERALVRATSDNATEDDKDLARAALARRDALLPKVTAAEQNAGITSDSPRPSPAGADPDLHSALVDAVKASPSTAHPRVAPTNEKIIARAERQAALTAVTDLEREWREADQAYTSAQYIVDKYGATDERVAKLSTAYERRAQAGARLSEAHNTLRDLGRSELVGLPPNDAEIVWVSDVGQAREYSRGCGPYGHGSCDWCDCRCHEAHDLPHDVAGVQAWHEQLWAQYEPDSPYRPRWERIGS